MWAETILIGLHAGQDFCCDIFIDAQFLPQPFQLNTLSRRQFTYHHHTVCTFAEGLAPAMNLVLQSGQKDAGRESNHADTQNG